MPAQNLTLDQIQTRTAGLRVFPSGSRRRYTVTYRGFYYVHHSSGNEKQIFRWVKYEESIEEGGQRWSKPYVSAIQLNALNELRRLLEEAEVQLCFDCSNDESACRYLVQMWTDKDTISLSERNAVLRTLLRPHVHLYERETSMVSTLFNRKPLEPTAMILPSLNAEVLRKSSISSAVYRQPIKDHNEKNVQFLRKIPANAECANILVGKFTSLSRPVAAFLKLKDASVLGNFTEVHLPTRFLFVLLGPEGKNYSEIGRAVGTLLTDPTFKNMAYRSDSKDQILKGIDQFLETVSILPPAIWDASIRLDPPERGESEHGGSDHGDVVDNGLARTGRPFGGLINDIKRKIPWYPSDIKDAFSLQVLATWMFLYFACLTPLITFGGLMGEATKDKMATIETMVSGCVCGVIFALFSGQPLIILGSTGPMLVFEKILVNFAESRDLDYLEFRLWVGLWTALILLLLVAADASSFVAYITKFTEDNFATLIATIFMVEAIKNVVDISHNDNDEQTNDPEEPNATAFQALGFPILTALNSIQPDHLSGLSVEHSNDKPMDLLMDALETKSNHEVFLMSLLLFFGTFFISYMLKRFRMSPFFPTWFRYLASDFGVIIAILGMTLVDYGAGIETPKLLVPEKFAPTSDQRNWFISPFDSNPLWSVFVAAIPALLVTILIFMDQQITAVIINRKNHKLKKGSGYHLDLFVLSLLIVVTSFFGLPWFVAATVESLTNISSLRMESESAAPGEKPTVLGVREQRVSNLLVFVTVGMSVLLTPVLKNVPMPVLYGVFLYMGFSAILRMELFHRILLLVMPLKYQPNHHYLKKVPLRRIHLFTLIQIACFGLLYIIKSINATAIAFPVMLVVMIIVRKLLEYVFTQHELLALDDPLPGAPDRLKDETSDTASDIENHNVIDHTEQNYLTVPKQDY